MLVGSFGISAVEHTFESAGIKQASLFSKGKPAHQSQTSGCETLAAFGTATVDNVTTALGCHACTKTVGACAFQDARLECSFHD